MNPDREPDSLETAHFDSELDTRALAAAAAAAADGIAGAASGESSPTRPLGGEHALPPAIGPYHILSLINEGGMGSVFKAEQRHPIRRIVALKIIKLGLDTKEVIARFDSERQALARMDHPNIAKVFDAGATETGRPYFVMEYVPGKPVTLFADENKLSIRARLELFTAACEAIAHAHTKAVIHRDIKAANVLAYLQDGQAKVKVIDFGIAKALTSDRLTEHTFNTQSGHIIGTYDSMSPEQAEGSADIDTRTDVYSLGVLLYELLTGFRPFDSATLRRAAEAEVKRIIREVEPPRPSTRLSGHSADVEKIASARHTRGEQLARQLRGELEWIPLKAMRKERERRYDSATELAADVRNYIDGRPLIAGPESTVYRTRKFVTRHRGVVAATAAIIIAVATASLLYVRGIKRAQAETVAALNQAEEERRTRTAVSNVLEKMLAGAGPSVAQGRDTQLLKDLLDEARRDVDRLQDQPIVQASVLLTLGETYSDIGELDTAEKTLTRSRGLFEANGSPRGVGAITAGIDLAGIARSRSRYADAELLGRQTVSDATASLGPDHRITLAATEGLAVTLQEMARHAESEPLFRDVYERRKRLLGDDDKDTLVASHNLAYFIGESGRPVDAEPIIRDTVARRARVLGEMHPDTLASVHALASILLHEGKIDDSAVQFQVYHDRCLKVYGKRNRFSATATAELGRIAAHRGNFEGARELFERSVAMYHDAGADDDTRAIQALDDLGFVLQRLGQSVESERLARETIARRERLLGPDHPDTLRSVTNLAVAKATMGGKENLAEAATLCERAFQGTRRALGPTHSITIGYMNLLGDIYQAGGRDDDALATYRELYQIAPTAQAAPADIAKYVSSLGLMLAKTGKYEEAIEPLKAAESRIAAVAPRSPMYRRVVQLLIDCCTKAGRSSDAKAWQDQLTSLGEPTTRPTTQP